MLNFYETSHGTSVCDGLGAVIKSCCYHTIISGRAIVKDAADFCKYCEKHLVVPMKHATAVEGSKFLSKRQLVFLNRDDVDCTSPEALTLVGIRKLHRIKGTGKTLNLEPRTLKLMLPYVQKGRQSMLQ